MGAAISAPLSCLGSCAGTMAGAACCAAMTCRGVVPSSFAMTLNVTLVLLFASLALVLHGGAGAISIAGYELCPASRCSGAFAVYRVSAVLAAFYTLMALVTAAPSRAGATAHRGFWIAKAVVLLVLVVSTAWVDNDVFAAYREIARFASLPFLLVQIVILIGFGYDWNGSWCELDGDNDGICGWKGALLLCSLLLYAGSAALWVVSYQLFSCGGAAALTSAVVVLSLAATFIGTCCRSVVPHGTIVTSAVVTIFSSFHIFSALGSSPDASCNPLAASGAEPLAFTAANMTAGCVLLTLTLLAAQPQAAEGAVVGVASGDDPSRVTVHTRLEEEEAAATAAEVEPEGYWRPNLTLALVSLYLAMLLTSWSTLDADAAADTHPGIGAQNYGIKLTATFACLLLYLWTLVAPYALRDTRDFGIEFDD